MEIQITGRNHLEVTPPIRDHVIERFGKLSKHFKNITNIHVTLSVEKKFQHNAEAHIDLSQGNIFAKATSEDMYETIDKLFHKVDRQVLKHKEEMKDHKGEGIQ